MCKPATVLDAASDPADLSLRSPPTAPGCTTDYAPQKACDNENNYVVENVDDKEENVKRKSMLSAEVQKILKEEKLDFNKLVEAVRNDKLPSDLLEHDEDEDYSYSDYENYPPEYWDFDIHDVTEEEADNDDTNEVTNHDETNLNL